MKSHKSWVMALPQGLRDQPAAAFIGVMCSLSGLSYFIGKSQSNAILKTLGPTWLRMWGGFLFVSGVLVVVSIFKRNHPLEKLSLRLLSVGLLVYMGWVLTSTSLANATLTMMLCSCLIFLGEVRVGTINTQLKPLPDSTKEAG